MFEVLYQICVDIFVERFALSPTLRSFEFTHSHPYLNVLHHYSCDIDIFADSINQCDDVNLFQVPVREHLSYRISLLHVEQHYTSSSHPLASIYTILMNTQLCLSTLCLF